MNEPKSCLKCGKSSVRSEIYHLNPCRHSICLDCYVLEFRAQNENSPNADPLAPASIVDCPSCKTASSIQRSYSVPSICGESVLRSRVGKFHDLPCDHSMASPKICGHCSASICSNCEKQHKEIIRYDIFEMTRKLGTILPDVRENVDFRLISLRFDEDVAKLAYQIDEKISLAIKALSDRLLNMRDAYIEEAQSQLTAKITDARKCYGDFKQTKLLISDLKSPAVFGSISTDEVVSNFTELKRQLTAVENYKNNESQINSSNLSSLIGSFSSNNDNFDSLVKNVVNYAADKLMSELKITEKVDAEDSGNTQNNQEVIDWGDCRNSGQNATIKEEPTKTPLPVNVSYAELRMLQLMTDIPSINFPFKKPSWISLTKNKKYFVVVHNQNRVSVFDCNTLEIVSTYNVVDLAYNRLVFSGDIAIDEQHMYLCNQERNKIYRLKFDTSTPVHDQAVAFVFFESRLKLFGLDILRSTNQLVFANENSISALDIREDATPRNRTVSTLFESQSHFMYLQEATSDEKSLIFSKKRTVYRKNLVFDQDKAVKLIDDVSDKISGKRLEKARGVHIDDNNILIVADQGMKCLEFFDPDGVPMGSFRPRDIPNFDPCAIVVLPNGNVIVTEFANDRFAVFGR